MVTGRPAGLRLAQRYLQASIRFNGSSVEQRFSEAFRHTPFTIAQRRSQSNIANVYAPSSAPHQQRSLPLRLLFSAFRGLLFTFAGFYIGAMYSPDFAAVLALARSNKITEAETLSLYVAADPLSASVNAHILAHPVAVSLRANPSFTESRPHMKIPEALRPTNLTGGTLAGPGKIVVPPLIFAEKGGKSMVSLFYLGEQLCGHPGIVHGGMLATLLDEGLARCCFPALPSKIGVTANLKVDYRKPARAGTYYVLRAETTKVEGRKAWVKGWIEDLVDETKGEKPTKYVEAEALFIEPRNAKVMKRIYTGEP